MVIKISKTSSFLGTLNTLLNYLRKARFRIPYWTVEGDEVYTHISQKAVKYAEKNFPKYYQLLTHYLYNGI